MTPEPDHPPLDARFSLANERTYLAWIRTSLALIAVGLVAAKAIEFHHVVLRWPVDFPPFVGAAALALEARGRWRAHEAAMSAGEPLPAGRNLGIVSALVAAYAILVLVVAVLDG
jgi:putative membrane protein